MSVEIVDTTSPELVSAMNDLIPQLSSSTPPLSPEQIESFVAQDYVYLFVYRPDTEDESGDRPILGMLSLATFDIPTGRRAWIEDVVVDNAARGQGAGQKLVEAAVRHAQAIGAKSVDLTSRPSREAANRLYRRAGFVLRETNVYRFEG
ncbi:GNAT family N-acetyltransferase [Actinomycetaceae bacterium L2_0104]